MTLYKLGSYGIAVRQIQARLTKLGYYRSLVDGRFGSATHSAVADFQRANNLISDGIVDLQTWQTLFKLDIPPPYIPDRALDLYCISLMESFEICV
jgi:peptidoglycan hydrolase-like protein with peptidoglycan-binding domain